MASNQHQLIRDILRWGRNHGVVLDGVTAKAIPNRGIGMVATRALKPGDKIITIPLAITRNIKNIRPSIISRTLDAGISNLTVHSLMAADLALSLQNSPLRTGIDDSHIVNNGLDNNPWLKALPSYQNFAKTIPYFFPPELQVLLPKPARDIIAKQNSIIDHDFAILSKIDWSENGDEAMTKEQFIHAWFIVNTRTFHYVAPGQQDACWDDQMALVPIADFINHGADKGCLCGFSEEGYIITAEREFKRGEELSLCYGRHSNDALMAEYGFIIEGEDGMTGNKWDSVDLEEFILEVGRTRGRGEIEKKELEGKNLKIDWEGNIHQDVTDTLRKLVVVVFDDRLEHEVKEFLWEVLQALLDKFGEFFQELRDTVGDPDQWDIMIKRWGQIERIRSKAIDRLVSVH